MKNKSQENIFIEPKSKRHQSWLLFLGISVLILCLLLSDSLLPNFKLQLIFLSLIGLIITFVGLVKHTEPNDSYQLQRTSMIYFHRFGKINIDWQAIRRIGEVKGFVQGIQVGLPYIGIQLDSLEKLANSISPRLANRLLHEQQELLVLAAKNKEIILENGLIHFEAFDYAGKVYKGPLAAWLYRTEQLHSVYGYHLYLPENSFDRELIDFLSLLINCKKYSVK